MFIFTTDVLFCFKSMLNEVDELGVGERYKIYHVMMTIWFFFSFYQNNFINQKKLKKEENSTKHNINLLQVKKNIFDTFLNASF